MTVYRSLILAAADFDALLAHLLSERELAREPFALAGVLEECRAAYPAVYARAVKRLEQEAKC